MIEDKKKFLKRLAKLDSESIRMVDYAYDLTKSAHRHQQRDGGNIRYFEHPRAVALILMDEVEVYDPEMICAALLHDVAEDTSVFGSNRGVNYKHWREVAAWRISNSFTARVARIVLDVSKPFADGSELKTDEEAKMMYFENLRLAEPDSIVIKMSDRLHNLRTMATVTYEKRVRKVKETEDYYLTIFERAKGYGDGQVYEQLSDKIDREIERNKLMQAS